MNIKMQGTDVKSAAYADVQQDAKAFYRTVAANGQVGAMETLRALDPPDPVGDKHLVDHYRNEVVASLQYPVQPGTVADAKLHEYAEGRATLARWISKAAGSDQINSVKDFFTNSAVTALFPAFVEARIQQGRLGSGLVNDLIFADVTVDSITGAKMVYSSSTAADRSLKIIEEGALIPTTTIRVADSTVQMVKYGRMLQWSYESAASQSVDMIGNELTRIGAQMGIDETDRLMSMAIAGDGTTAGAAETNSTDYDVAAAGTVTLADLVGWYYGLYSTTLYNAYQIDKAVGNPTDLAQLAQLSQFNDVDLISGQSTLRLPSPLAVRYYVWPATVAGSSFVNRLICGFDSRSAMMAYTYGGFIDEADKLIDQQLNRRAFSYWRGFRKYDFNAVYVLDCNAAL